MSERDDRRPGGATDRPPVADGVPSGGADPDGPHAAIRVVVVDDHHVVRRGLRSFLEVMDDIVVVGEGADGEQALELVRTLRPDVLVLDLQLPRLHGVEVLRTLRESGDERATRVLVLTSFTEPSSVVPALRAGAAGYVFKDVEPASLAQGIRAVHSGQMLLDPEVGQVLLAADEAPVSNLTERERQVLAEVARGRSNREIARQLVLSEKTVKTHISSILAKLHLTDRTQAALFAVRAGLV